jgi:hypothetical protein
MEIAAIKLWKKLGKSLKMPFAKPLNLGGRFSFPLLLLTVPRG